MFLASGDKPNPLGHVLDMDLIGGAHPLLHFSEGWTIFGSPILTVHMVTLVAAAILLVWVMKIAARAITTGPESEGNERYITTGRLAQLVEVITVYLKDTIIKPILGGDTNKYLPYLLTLFFFVLANNLFGLVPLLDLQHIIGAFLGNKHFAVIGGTATANLAVTAALALIAFVVIQWHGFRELGIGGWAHHLLGGAPVMLAPLMIPVELIGMLIKPAALAIRLFANMMAGHMLLATLALFGVMALHGMNSWIAAFGVSVIAGAFAIAITFLELFIAFLQAFIFMILTAVFIGQLSHHGEHDESEHAEAAHA